MPFRYRHSPGLWQAAEHRDLTILFDGVYQHRLMAAAGNVVEDHPCDVDLRLKLLVPAHKRRHAPGHAGGVHHQDHRGTKQPRQLCGATAPGQVQAIVEPHGSFDDG